MATAWNNGEWSPTGGGYGIRIRRDEFHMFNAHWQQVRLTLGNGNIIDVNISPSFWAGCRELRSRVIGQWLIDSGVAPWTARRPPVIMINRLRGNHFRVELA